MIKLKTLVTEITKNDHYWHPGVNHVAELLVIRKTTTDTQVLLVQRSEKRNRGKWAIPGGYQDTNQPIGAPFKEDKEDIRDAAIRELKEETNLDLSKFKNKLILIEEFKCGRDVLSDGQIGWKHMHDFAVLIDDSVDISHVRGGDDAPEAKFFDIKEIEKLTFTGDWKVQVYEALNKLLK